MASRRRQQLNFMYAIQILSELVEWVSSIEVPSPENPSVGERKQCLTLG